MLERLPSDLDDAPAFVKRESDDVIFYCFKRGIYLPLGYRPADPKDLDGSWPKALVRESDDVKFIRISGGSYDRGDFIAQKSQQPVLDLQDNPCQLHKVEVSGFYIQETEVTNKEVAEFQTGHAEVPLNSWKDAKAFLIEDQKKSEIELQQFPAVCINRTTAQQIAKSVSGRLPTEAEWEYAARSGGTRSRWAGKNQVIKKTPPKARLASVTNAGEFFPVRVKSFAGEDETDQKVFDMTGNVCEWCVDEYKSYPTIISEHIKAERTGVDGPLHDPVEGDEPEKVDSSKKYVVRGGSFNSQPEDARTFQRTAVQAYEERNDLGFRVVIQCPPEIVDIAQ